MYKINLDCRGKFSTQLKRKKELIVLLVLCTIVFCVLYHKILWGGYIYAYKDIGSDTLYSYLPNFIFDGEWIRSGKSSEYTLQYGLGIFLENPLLKYIIPFNILFIFCDSVNIGVLLVISLYMKIITIAIFSYMYFDMITENKKAALAGGMIWSFCSYVVVWGQHYQFGTRIALFTVGIYFLEKYLRCREKKYIFIGVLTLMWFDSYYAIYMNGIFFALYVIVRGIQLKYNIKTIILYLAKLAGMAFIAAALAMIRLLPEVMSLLSSTRMSDVLEQSSGVPWHYGKDYLLSFLARFLSANTIGIGNSFSGAYNYYEVALLSTSLLSVFALAFFLCTKYRKYVVAVIAMAAIALGFPIISQVLNMNYLKQRWSYLLCFVFVISIVNFISYIQKHEKDVQCKAAVKYCIVIADICYMGICMILFMAHKVGWVTVDKAVLLAVIVVVILYNVFLIWYSVSWSNHVWYFIYGTICAELLIMNYPSINNRDIVSAEEWRNALYNDGTREVIDMLKQEDSRLYRVNKSYISVSGYNEALIQDYNGVCVYSSLNTAELVEFYTFWGYELLGGHPHYVFIPDEDYIINTMLGVKYLITDKTEEPLNQYRKLFENDKFIVYENKNALTFGYLYDTEICKNDVESLNGKERQRALLYGFFLSSGEKVGITDQLCIMDEMNQENDYIQLKKLQDNSFSSFSYAKDGFQGKICNKNEQDSMLVMPIIYNSKWSIYIDGVKQRLYNVNGGLLGVILSSGEHSISLVYEQFQDELAVTISCISFMVLIVNYIYNKRKKNCDGYRVH